MAKAQIKREMNPAAGSEIGQNGPVLVAEKAEIDGIAPKPSKKPKKPIDQRTRFSGAELRQELQTRLPDLKASRRKPEEILTGRPSSYRPEIGLQILDLMSEGMTLTESCEHLGLHKSTIYRWAEKNPSFATTLARAKRALAEHSFSQAHAIPKALYEQALNGEPIDGPMVAAARLYTDSLKWYAERLNPHEYAPQSKQAIELTGKNGGPIQTTALVLDSRMLSPDARDALRQALLTAKPNEINEIEGEFEETPGAEG